MMRRLGSSVRGAAKIFLMATLFLLPIFIGCGIIGSSSPSAVAEKYYQLLVKGDMVAVGEYTTPEMVKEMSPFLSDKERYLMQIAALGKINAAEEKINGDTAIVALQAENEKELSWLMLVKVNNKWKVHTGKEKTIYPIRITMRLKELGMTDDDIVNYVSEDGNYELDLTKFSDSTPERFVDEIVAHMLGISGEVKNFAETVKRMIPEERIKWQTRREENAKRKAQTSTQKPGKYPQASERVLTVSDLQHLGHDDLKIMRNEIFARHGYVFEMDDMKSYFRKQNWYTPKHKDVNSMLTNIERENVAFIRRYEQENSGNVKYVNSPDGVLNLRQGPSADTRLLVALPQGTAVNIDNSGGTGQWVRVTYGQYKGFVNKNYLSDVQPLVGSGEPGARVTQKGVLGIVSGQIKGKTVASADIFGKGGFSTDTDQILSGVGGLKAGGDGGVGRKGAAGTGYGSGYGSGFGGGGGIGHLDGLVGGGSGLDLKKKGELKVSSPDLLKGGQLTGGRSRASIQRVVMQNMAALRYAYNRRLRDKPGLAGKVTVEFAINEFGTVTSAQVVESTMNDKELENTIVSRVKSWNFDKIDVPGDVTVVTYPFVFSQ